MFDVDAIGAPSIEMVEALGRTAVDDVPIVKALKSDP
jgi:hypothetical protein